jgi:hypothetical protein
MELRRGTKDLTGMKFGFLKVIELHGYYQNSNRYYSTWQCSCECGKTVTVRGCALTGKKTMSCGCYQRQVSSAVNMTHGCAPIGGSTKEYRLWQNIKSRCLNKSHPRYQDYGGRGISIHGPWMESFERFVSDVGLAPSKKHSLDRFPDNNGNYEPGNVRWATATEQARNARSNRMISHNGRSMLLCEWAIEMKCPESTLLDRLSRGWSVDQTFGIPVTPRRQTFLRDRL